MSGKRGAKSDKGTAVPVRFDERFIQALDGRSEVARRLRDRLAALTADLGGLSALSYQEQSLCKRAVHMESLIEDKELALASGRRVDENKYVNAVCCLSGLFSKIGLKRRVKVLSLKDYVSHRPVTSDPVSPAPMKGDTA